MKPLYNIINEKIQKEKFSQKNHLLWQIYAPHCVDVKLVYPLQKIEVS